MSWLDLIDLSKSSWPIAHETTHDVALIFSLQVTVSATRYEGPKGSSYPLEHQQGKKLPWADHQLFHNSICLKRRL